MWLMTIHGFYSCVKSKVSSEQMIRARSKDHLSNLIRSFPEILSKYVIMTTEHTDYPYRLIVSKEDWLKLSDALASEATHYSNFKGASYACNNDVDYDDFLHEVWELGCNQLQKGA